MVNKMIEVNNSMENQFTIKYNHTVLTLYIRVVFSLTLIPGFVMFIVEFSDFRLWVDGQLFHVIEPLTRILRRTQYLCKQTSVTFTL